VNSKANSWRDAGDTCGRKNHQEEAKLQYLHTTSLRIASPRHNKWRNQEGSHTTRCQLLTCLGDHQNYYSDTNTRTGCWRTNTKTIRTETLLHLNLGNFIFFIFIFFITFFSILSLSL
jgi:hypothetical protein